MDDDERAYREAMEAAERALQTIHDQVQHVADRFANGAMLSYPNEYQNPELAAQHARLTARADEIIDRMREIHRAFVSRTPPATAE